ncbi:MAG: cysteine dioxygenase family protein [Thermomicrobiales bacterium]|nr:cysteine dioxygenase family protein [Thermomicrobiales bacterium]
MCEFQNAPPPTGVDEFFVDTPRFHAFIKHCNAVRAGESDPRAIVARIRPALVDLMKDQTWLPDELAQPKENSGMGGGIGMWLLYRAGDGGLAFSSLVVPPGAQTPVHDHLAWGLVGLYRGTQDEDVFQRRDDASVEDTCDLELIESKSLVPGDMYELLPENDIHRVRTTSDVTSVSLHLLGNDNGCIWRHRFHPDEHRVEPFKSGWLNVPCTDQAAAAD